MSIQIIKNGVSFCVQNNENYASFWQTVANGEWEPETFSIFDAYLTPETTYLDAGAWIGPTLLYAAARSRRAIGFEPDPTAFAELRQNLDLNPALNTVQIEQACIWKEEGMISLGNPEQQGNSMSSILFQQASNAWQTHAIFLPD